MTPEAARQTLLFPQHRMFGEGAGDHLTDGRFRQGVENAPDWNISRNRYWATALPFWKCENKEELED